MDASANLGHRIWFATATLRSAARGLKRHRESRKHPSQAEKHRESRKHPSHGGPLRFLPEEHRSEAEKNREYTFQPDEAVEAIKAPQVILSKAHKEYRTRKSRGQKQGNVDELISMPETLAEAVWV